MQPGRIQRREFEYERHGTQSLIANLEIAKGRVIAPSIGQTRTESDFLTHIQQTVAIDPTAEWIFVVDQLNTHPSASLVRWVAQVCDIDLELGTKGESGILQSMATRATFLQDPTHRIRFIYTPKHTSWLNQIELWFSNKSASQALRGAISPRLKTSSDRFCPLLPTSTRRWLNPSNGLTRVVHWWHKLAYYFCRALLASTGQLTWATNCIGVRTVSATSMNGRGRRSTMRSTRPRAKTPQTGRHSNGAS